MKTELTNLEKVFWPDEGYTKGYVINYYRNIAPVILPYLKNRPQSLFRQPNGIKDKGFFQKNVSDLNLPSFAKSINIASDGGITQYLLCQNKETLLYMANLGCIELNPWLSSINNLHYPDYMLIDLDPGEEADFSEAVETALAAHRILDKIEVPNFCKTSGKTGLHIVVPLGGRYIYDDVRKFAELVAVLINKEKPEITSLERKPAKRRDRIYPDYLQNSFGQTITAPYSLRPCPGATVSAPLRWKEVNKNLKIADYNINSIFKRLDKTGDLWRETRGSAADIGKSLDNIKFIFKI